MAKQQDAPVFVNLHSSVVQVYDEGRRPVRVAPWGNRNRGQDALFVVTGEHYRQFVSSKGPLFPRPAGAGSAAPAPSTASAAGDKKVPGDQTPGADGGGKKEADKVPADLSEYNVEAAVECITETTDPTVLKAWAEAEAAGDDRKGVKEAVEKRLAELG